MNGPGEGGETGDAGEFEVGDVLDRMTDAFFAVDREWRLTYLNQRGREALHQVVDGAASSGDPLGESLWELVPAAVDTEFHDRFVEAMESMEPVSFELYYEPTDAWFAVNAYPSSSGLSAFLQEVTTRKRLLAERERREGALREIYRVISAKDSSLEEKVDTLLSIGESLLDVEYGVLSHVEGEEYVFEVVHDPDGAIRSGDAVPLGATNCERAILEERTLVLADVARDAPDLADRAGNVRGGVESYIGTPVVVDGDVFGTFCFYDREARPDPFEEWEVTLVELMGNWVSYELEREHQAAAIERERNRLDEFASVVSHDLRNPLNVAQLEVELAAEDRPHERLEGAQRALSRMGELIDDVLAFARSGTAVVEPEPIDLAATARAAWTTAGDGRDSLDVDEDLGAVDGDRSRVQQLLENLFRNAVEHAGSDASIRVGVLPNRGGFYVADDGPGIPEPDREDVLQSGYSLGADGTGFGLSIVQAIVEAHGWELRLEESAEGGARVEVHGVSIGGAS